MNQRFTLSINGTTHTIEGEPAMPLLDVLRNGLGLKGTRYGCGDDQCGACNVIVDGRAIASCTLELWAVAGKSVVTVEGLGTPAALHPLQQAFIDEQAAQCGYCTSGMLTSAAALLERVAHPTADEVKAALDRNLCRCGAHGRIVRAVLRAAAGSKDEAAGVGARP